jgi:hypothetical protein
LGMRKSLAAIHLFLFGNAFYSLTLRERGEIPHRVESGPSVAHMAMALTAIYATNDLRCRP